MHFSVVLFLIVSLTVFVKSDDESCSFRVEKVNTTMYYFFHEYCQTSMFVDVKQPPYFDFIKKTCNLPHSNSFELVKMGSCSDSVEYEFILVESNFWGQPEPKPKSIILQWTKLKTSIFGKSNRATIHDLSSISFDSWFEHPSTETGENFKIFIFDSSKEEWEMELSPDSVPSLLIEPECEKRMKESALFYFEFEYPDLEFDGYLCRVYGRKLICIGNEFEIDGIKRKIMKIGEDGLNAGFKNQNGVLFESFYSNRQLIAKNIGNAIVDGRVAGKKEVVVGGALEKANEF